MPSYPNIDRSGFRPGEYVGYAHGAWKIYRIDPYEWRCLPMYGVHADVAAKYPYGFTAATLREISERLATLNV